MKKLIAISFIFILLFAIHFSSIENIESASPIKDKCSFIKFKWIDDDGIMWTDADDDGILPYIPPIEHVPLVIQFQIIKDNSTYFGQENQKQAMENITLLGDVLFTGSLDSIPEVSFINDTTWNIPVIPRMDINGGEINITITAWNTIITEKLSIGKNLNNGAVVTIVPEEFYFDSFKKFKIQVTDEKGITYNDADIFINYIGDVDGGINGNPMEDYDLIHLSGGGDQGIYLFELNPSQQTINQTLAGFTNIRNRRNLSVYVKLNIDVTSEYIYGYAIFEMKPLLVDLEYEFKGGFGISIIVTNRGPDCFRGGLLYNYSINGTIVLSGKHGISFYLIRLEPNETGKLPKHHIFAIGVFNIKVNLSTGYGLIPYYIEIRGFAIGFYIMILN